MAWKGRTKPPVDYANLVIQLNNAKLQDKNFPLYQLLYQLITTNQQDKSQINSILNSFFGDLTINDDTDLSAILTAIASIKDVTVWTENNENPTMPFSRMVVAGVNVTLDYSVPGIVTIDITGTAGSTADFLTWSDESGTLPNSRNLVAGTNVTFDDTVPNVRTINVSGSSSPSGGAQLHGLQRLLGDGATTTFNLLDFAEYLEHVGVNGSFADPATFSLSTNRNQIIFAAAPGAGEVITIEYVTATL